MENFRVQEKPSKNHYLAELELFKRREVFVGRASWKNRPSWNKDKLRNVEIVKMQLQIDLGDSRARDKNSPWNGRVWKW